MHILHISPSYYPHIGGVEYVVKSVAERLVKMGHEITVIAGEPEIEKPLEEVINNVRVIRWPVWSPGNAYHIPRFRIALRDTLNKVIPYIDIVHVHSIHSVFTVWVALNIKGAHRLVVTSHYHGTGHTLVRRGMWLLWRFWVAKLLGKANVIHAVSPREARVLSSHYQEAEGKIKIIPNGVDEDVFDYRFSGWYSDYIIYAGRIERYKRLELAINKAKDMGLKLLVLGEGSYIRSLERYANKVHPEGVIFLPFKPRSEYLEILSKARYAINPSRHEAFSIFIAEALAIGVPSIVSKEIAENLCVKNQLDDKDFIIIEKANIEAWDDIVSRYLDELYSV
jgi:glycosyltransferase involved in cell wall biosynthesis